MNAQAGERYKCSDANCGCEIEVTNSGRTQQETSSDSSMNVGSFHERSRSNQPTGASATGVGALRNAESAGISTPGDFGSQGATGEGVFGTSVGNQRSTSSAWVQLRPAPLRPGSQSSRASNIETVSSGESNFYCACGQPMHKAQSSSRAASTRM
jgi:hypothetical protein